METIAQRVMKIVEANGGNMSEFARAIGVTPAYISKLGKEPDRVPSERTLTDICEKFNVNPVWLRTGEGEPFLPVTREEEISELVSRALNGSNDFKKAVIKMICSRTDAELNALEKALEAIYEDIQKEKDQA